MKTLKSKLLAMLLMCVGLMGCSSSEPPPAPELTEDVKNNVKSEDAAIDAAEAANSQ